MLADTNAIETTAKLRRVMDEPTQNKFIGKIRKAKSEIKTYLKNISASKKNLVKDISAVTMQLDCLQNIADLWAKGVANSMNEFETLEKSENADSNSATNLETNNEKAYSKKYSKGLFPHGHFPDVRASEGSNAHEEAIKWANNSKVNVGDWRLATYKDKWYIIEKFDTVDLKYQVTEKVSAKQYKFFREEWLKQYGNQETMARVYNEIDSFDRQTTKNERGRPNLDDDVFEYSKEDISIQRMVRSENREQSNQLDTGSGSVSSNENRQGNETFGLDKKSNSEKFSLKSIPNNRVLLANALETVTQNDIERKYIRDYKAHILMLEEQREKLKKINEEIGALSFATGKRDTARLKALTEERIKTQNRINIYDKKLLRLEACLFYPFVL